MNFFKQESNDNGHAPDLDLSGEVGQWISVKIDDYSFRIPRDMPTPLFVRLVQALSVLGGAMQGENTDPERVVQVDAELWNLTEELMRGAQPAPPRPLRDLFTNSSALRFLGHVAKEYSAATKGLTSSSPLPGSLTAPSA